MPPSRGGSLRPDVEAPSTMHKRPVEVLLVEPDVELASMMQDCLHDTIDGNVTVAPHAAAALREELTTRHDVLVLAADLPDTNWSDLARELRVTNRGPIVLLGREPSAEEMAAALRYRVMDVLFKPFDLAELCTLVDRAARLAADRQRARIRNYRLRRLTSRILRERRDLRQRIDLICRDFVHAYRRLAQRVTETDLLPRP